MPLAATGDLVRQAAGLRRAVPAFNVITLEHAEAVLAGATAAGTPVILQISQNAAAFHDVLVAGDGDGDGAGTGIGGGLYPLAAATRHLAERASVPASLHLDHVEDVALLEQALDAGFSSAMFDAGALPYQENVRATRAAVAWGHENGLWMEAELGYVGGKPGAAANAHTAGVRTDPDEARSFVQATGVDALAVAVGSSHAMTTRSASLDLDLIGRLAQAVTVPLVLHGSSGVPDADLAHAVAAGIRKVNIGTALNIAMTAAIRARLTADPNLVDPRRYLTPAREAMADAVRQLATVVRSGASS